MIDAALGKLGVISAIFVVHSWAGALGARMAIDYPGRVAGLVMLAPVAYPWRGGVGWYNRAVATPVIGPLLAYTITLPLVIFLAGSGARGADGKSGDDGSPGKHLRIGRQHCRGHGAAGRQAGDKYPALVEAECDDGVFDHLPDRAVVRDRKGGEHPPSLLHSTSPS